MAAGTPTDKCAKLGYSRAKLAQLLGVRRVTIPRAAPHDLATAAGFASVAPLRGTPQAEPPAYTHRSRPPLAGSSPLDHHDEARRPRGDDEYTGQRGPAFFVRQEPHPPAPPQGGERGRPLREDVL